MTSTDKGTDTPGRVPYEISWWQLSMLLVCVHLSLLVSYTPEIAGHIPPVRDAWLAALGAWVPGFTMAFIAWWLAKRFEGQNLYEFTRTIFGRVLGSLINGGTVLYFLYWATIVTREFATFMAGVVYLYTPELVFTVIFLIIAIVGASLHIEFVGRAAELSGPLIIGGVLLLLLGNIPHTDVGMLRPFLADGWRAVIQQAAAPTVIYGEAVWVAFIAMPYLNKLKRGPKALGVGFGLNVTFSVLTAGMLMTVFGTELLGVMAFPAISAARLIQLGTFLERLEWIMLLLWIGAMGVKLSFLLLAARMGISSLLPRQKPLIGLLFASVVVLIGSFYVLQTLSDVLNLFDAKSLVWPQLPLQVAPVIFAVVALIRGVGAGRR